MKSRKVINVSALLSVLSAVLLLFFLVAPADAVVRKNTEEAAAVDSLTALVKGGNYPGPVYTHDEATEKARAVTDSALQTFRSRYGSEWLVQYDESVWKPCFLMGGPIPFIPGKGNSLRLDNLPFAGTGAPAEIDLDTLEPMARLLIADIKELHGIEDGDLVLNRSHSGIFGVDGQVWWIDFDRTFKGIPVLYGRIGLGVSHGNIVQIRLDYTGDIPRDLEPVLSAPEAVKSVGNYIGGFGEKDTITEGGVLFFLPRPRQAAGGDTVAPGGGYDYELLYRVSFRKDGSLGSWVAWVDAVTGEVREFFDTNDYTSGRVSGMIKPRAATDTETELPIHNELVTVGGNPSTSTDTSGNYSTTDSGQETFTFMSHPTTGGFTITNRSGANASVTYPQGPIVNHLWSNSNSRADERNAFYHLNAVRQRSKTYTTNFNAIQWFRQLVTANVGISGMGLCPCNAMSDGTALYFCNAGGGLCSNTGEIASVGQHEWGHLFFNQLGGPNETATSEAFADTTAVLMQQDPIIGPSFWTNVGSALTSYGIAGPVFDPTALRDVSKTMTTSNISNRCTRQNPMGPLGYEGHCEGEIPSGAIWDLSDLLREKYGDAAGWDYAEKLHATRPINGNYLSSAYYDYLIADDDDGNFMLNGTPNACLIYQAFQKHGIAGTAYPCSGAYINLSYTSHRIADAAGDNDGIAEPGETVGIPVTVGNGGNTTANNVTGTITTSATGVTITAPTATFPAISAGGSAESNAPYFQVTLDAGVSCGTRIPFDITLTDGTSVFKESFELEVGTPAGTIPYLYTSFDSGAGGWTGNTGSNTDGNWLQGRPNVTAQYNIVYQTDQIPAGTGCYFTGQNANWQSLTSGDVSGGTAVAESPIFDLSTAQNPAVSYYRWFVSLFIKQQTQDNFVVEITNGTTTVTLETLDHSEDKWVRRQIGLKGLIPFTSTMRLRFKATDSGSNGTNIVEAAIDEVKVEEFKCGGSGCPNPGFTYNSLKAAKTPATVSFYWSAPSAGEWNVHRTDVKQDLPALWQNATTIQPPPASAPQYDEDGWPPAGTVYYYEVYARDSCTGASVAP
jgi:hypothetical protein